MSSNLPQVVEPEFERLPRSARAVARVKYTRQSCAGCPQSEVCEQWYTLTNRKTRLRLESQRPVMGCLAVWCLDHFPNLRVDSNPCRGREALSTATDLARHAQRSTWVRSAAVHRKVEYPPRVVPANRGYPAMALCRCGRMQ
jgi:hypothetical protein